jgi:hypothetical protein
MSHSKFPREMLWLASRATVAPLVPPERLQFLAARIHELGPRPLYELCRELERGAELHPALEKYAALAPLADFIRAHGGDRLPEVRLVAGGPFRGCSNTHDGQPESAAAE